MPSLVAVLLCTGLVAILASAVALPTPLRTTLATHCTAPFVALLLWPAEACCTAAGPAAAAYSGKHRHVVFNGVACNRGPERSDDGMRHCLA